MVHIPCIDPNCVSCRDSRGASSWPRRSASAESGDASKKDGGKLRYDLIPPEALEELARIYTIGAAKYADNGWLSPPMRWGRIFAAMMRHAWAWWGKREMYDPVDGQHHMAAVAWCAFALMTYEIRGIGDNDRDW